MLSKMLGHPWHYRPIDVSRIIFVWMSYCFDRNYSEIISCRASYFFSQRWPGFSRMYMYHWTLRNSLIFVNLMLVNLRNVVIVAWFQKLKVIIHSQCLELLRWAIPALGRETNWLAYIIMLVADLLMPGHQQPPCWILKYSRTSQWHYTHILFCTTITKQ